jgi:uracil phosphoribosyltransferase
MSAFVLNQDTDNNEVSQLIEICKSSSRIIGTKLRQAHYRLGQLIANEIIKHSVKEEYAVLIMMRAGLFFGNGIADQIEEVGLDVSMVLVDGNQVTEDELALIRGRAVLVVDAVINTGKSIFEVIEQLSGESITLVTTVIPDTSLQLFEEVRLYSVRTSKNKYTGAKVMHISNGKGPDTGDRLFNTM